MTSKKMIVGFLLMVTTVILLLVMILWHNVPSADAAVLGDGLSIRLEGGELVADSWRIDYQPAPAEVREFPLVLRNTSQETRKIDLSIAEAVLADGHLTYQPLDFKQEALSDLARIVKLKVAGAKESSSVLVLEPTEEASVILEIDSGAIAEPLGEVFGAVKITESVIEESEKAQQVGVKMAMSSVIQICLRFSTEEKTSLAYRDLRFATVDGVTVLQGAIKNLDPMLRYADVGGFQIRDAAEKVIADGELTDQFVFPPSGETTFSWPLGTEVVLHGGDYQLLIETESGTKVFDFTFYEADLSVSEPSAVMSSEKKVQFSQKSDLWIGITIVVFIFVGSVVIIKGVLKRKVCR